MASISIQTLILSLIHARLSLCHSLSPTLSSERDTPSFFSSRDNLARSTCSNATYSACGDGLPSNFCCPSDNTCFVTASNTTVVCCPSGESCGTISPIDCDIQLQNATAYPDILVHTTKFGEALPSCGGKCCPWGYKCENNGCVVDSGSSSSSTTTTPTTTAVVAVADTVSTVSWAPTTILVASGGGAGVYFQPSDSTPTQTTPTSSPSATQAATNSSQAPKNTWIVIGATAGAFAVIASVAFIFFYIRRRKRVQTAKKSVTSDASSDLTWQNLPSPGRIGGIHDGYRSRSNSDAKFREGVELSNWSDTASARYLFEKPIPNPPRPPRSPALFGVDRNSVARMSAGGFVAELPATPVSPSPLDDGFQPLDLNRSQLSSPAFDSRAASRLTYESTITGRYGQEKWNPI